jgi:hypothetical protein
MDDKPGCPTTEVLQRLLAEPLGKGCLTWSLAFAFQGERAETNLVERPTGQQALRQRLGGQFEYSRAVTFGNQGGK